MFFDVLGDVLLERFAFEDLDVTGKTDVEAADARHVADVGSEVPDVLVALLTIDEILGPGEFLNEQVLGHEVKLEGDLGGGVA